MESIELIFVSYFIIKLLSKDECDNSIIIGISSANNDYTL